jgi:hypothetical protein
MWDNMEAKVNGLVASMNDIKELLLMIKGGLDASSSSKMFTVSIVEGSQMGLDRINCFKDIALTLMPGLDNIKPTPKP